MMNAMLVLVHTRYTASLLGELSREDSGINECFALHIGASRAARGVVSWELKFKLVVHAPLTVPAARP